MMTEEDIGKLLEALAEDFTTEELSGDARGIQQIKDLLDLEDHLLEIFLPAALELKQLRGDVKPNWAGLLQIH